MLKDNLHEVQDRVKQACEKAGRSVSDVTLIAVSKTKSIEMIDEIIAQDIVDFGENKPQELVGKYENLPKNLRWHMIGHLQRNKVKYIIDKVCLIHSVDSYRLAEVIQAEAEKNNIQIPVLIEVNIAEEDSKYGVRPEETEDLIRNIAKLPNIRVEGLMCIPPFVEIGEKNRKYFINLRNLYVDIKSKNIDNVNMCNLSMGMTSDYEIAIEEGATLVRVGTGIFGERNYV